MLRRVADDRDHDHADEQLREAELRQCGFERANQQLRLKRREHGAAASRPTAGVGVMPRLVMRLVCRPEQVAVRLEGVDQAADIRHHQHDAVQQAQSVDEQVDALRAMP